MEKKIEEKEKKIGELKEQINNNDPKKKKCLEQILNGKKRINESTMKVVNEFFNKHSSPVAVTMIEKLIGMLSGRSGKDAERISVELYFKSLKGLMRSLDEFNYKEVNKEVAQENIAFAKLMNTPGDEMNLSTDLLKIFKENESNKMDHFYTLGALMLAHAHLVIVSHEDEDCTRYIQKFEGQIESDKKEIELKHSVIASMKTKDELEEEKRQL